MNDPDAPPRPEPDATQTRWPCAIDGFVLGLVAASLCLLFLGAIPTGSEQAFNLLLGAIIGWGSSVVNYWRGSSRGSADKQQTIDRLMK